jgi:NhaP-type Na+/H+ or K+/H+ antiporter
VVVAESAANDGLAIALLMIPLLALTRGGDGVPWVHWALHVVLWEVIGAAVLGAMFGAVAGYAYRFARRHQALQTRALVPILAALAFAVLAGVKLAGGTGLLGVFTAGLVFRRFLGEDWKNSQEHFEAVTERLVTPLFVVLIGVLLPFEEWAEIGTPLVLAAAGVLLLRRLPAFLVLTPATPVFQDIGERAFVGWFGPIGVSAVSYAALAAARVDAPLLWPVTSAVVTASVVVHGLSATPLGRLLGSHEQHVHAR